MDKPDVLISPKYRLSDFDDKPTLDQKILIFEDRIKGWFLDVASEMLAKNDGTNGCPSRYFAVLAILAVYFEMIGQYESGTSSQNASRMRFSEGIEMVFPSVYSEIARHKIYKSLRCALYHNGLTSGAVVGQEHQSPFQFEAGLVWINPHTLFHDICEHFKTFIAKLREPANTNARQNFETTYDRNPKI